MKTIRQDTNHATKETLPSVAIGVSDLSPSVWVTLPEWSINGDHVQSTEMSTAQARLLAAQLIHEARRAEVVAEEFRQERARTAS